MNYLPYTPVWQAPVLSSAPGCGYFLSVIVNGYYSATVQGRVGRHVTTARSTLEREQWHKWRELISLGLGGLKRLNDLPYTLLW